MAVTKSTLVNEWSELANRERRYFAEFEVVTDNRSMSAKDAVAEAQSASPDPVPVYMATYSLLGDTDPNCFCQSIKPKRVDKKNATRFIVSVEWSPITGDPEDNFTSDDDPLARPLIQNVEWEEVQVQVDIAYNVEELPGVGRGAMELGPIQDGAGGEPSTPIMTTKRIPTLVTEKNFETWQEIVALAMEFDDCTNDATFYGAEPGTALFRGVEISKPQYSGGMTYYTGTFRETFDKKGWVYSMVNRGWAYLDDGELIEATIKDADGASKPVASPINLELDGTRTPDGQMGTVIHWETRERKNFSGLGIGG